MGAIGIAWGEISRRWMVFGIALFLGLVPMVLVETSLFSHRHYELADVCMLGGVLLSWIIAFVTGMTLIGRPLHDGRLSFLFTRPVSGGAIALGKIAGGLALVAGMELMLLAPNMRSELQDDTSGPLFAAGMATVFFAAGLVVGILARSRSRWFIVDAIGAALVSLFIVLTLGRINAIDYWMWSTAKLTPEEAEPIFHRERVLLLGLAVAAVVVALLAVAAAVAFGRTDRERVHRTLSIALWSGLLVVGVIGFIIAHWGIV